MRVVRRRERHRRGSRVGTVDPVTTTETGHTKGPVCSYDVDSSVPGRDGVIDVELRNSRRALFVALAVDNVGSGLFLPMALVYVTEVVGLPLSQAGIVVMLGTLVGLAVPPLAGRAVDRVGARDVVVTAQVVQAAGALAYLLAEGIATTLVAAVLLAAGQQLFYSSVFALIADVSGNGPKDKAFAVAGMIRTASFGAGSLAAGVLLTTEGPVGYQFAIGADGASFLVCALLLVHFVRLPRSKIRAAVGAAVEEGSRSPVRDRPYLALIATTCVLALSTDFFLVGVPVYAIDQLGAPTWLPGVILAVFTVIGATCGSVVVHVTRNLKRTTAISLSAGLFALWCVASALAAMVPQAWQGPYLVGTTVVAAVAGLVFSARVNALAEAAAPPATRGRYLAAFQYAFTIAGVIAPGVVALFAVAIWVPWSVVFLGACLAVVGLWWITPRLPRQAVVDTRDYAGL
jgi:MFS family permease